MTPAPSNRGKKAIALFFAWLLIAAACGSDGDDLADSDDAAEETNVDSGDDATTEEEVAEEEIEEEVDGEPEDEAGGDAGAVGTSYACEPTLNTSSASAAMYSAMRTDCDDAAGRNIEVEAERKKHNDAFLAEKRSAYPDSVVANPAECITPLSASQDPNAPGAGNEASAVRNSGSEADFYAMFVQGQILTVHDLDTFAEDVAEVHESLTITLLEELVVPEIEDSITLAGYDDLERNADGLLVLSRVAFDGLPELDALELSNLLLAADTYARPNYVLALAPGSQHSPANEPVPAHVDDVERFDTGLDYSQLSVAVLDSDRNFRRDEDGVHDAAAAAGEMRLWAGHMTFVSGVIDLLAPGVSIEREPFEAGEQLSEQGPFLSDWAFLKLFDPLGDSLLHKFEYSALNLSAGAYTCPLPEGVGEDQIQEAPPGILEVATKLQAQNILLVAAAGNDGLEPDERRRFWPAGLADSGQFDDSLIAVRAHDINGLEADFSNKFPENAVCALGVDVRSAYPTGDYLYSDGSSVGRFEGAAIWSGTSFATPMITAEYVNLRAGGENRIANEAMDHLGAIDSIRANHSC